MTYWQLQSVLDGLGSAVGAAQAHGCLCGALCVREADAAPEWLCELIDVQEAPGLDEASRLLQALHQETVAALRSQDFEFAPLVPDDGAALAERVQALADWCGGFLYGFGAGGADSRAAAVGDTGDVGEILRDLAEIAQARLDPREGAEAGEASFAELFEFVRAGAQLAFDELAAARTAKPRPAAAVH